MLILSRLVATTTRTVWNTSPVFYHRIVTLQKKTTIRTMAEIAETLDVTKLQDELDALNAQITKQGSTVRQLKKDGAGAETIDEAVKALQALKISAGELTDKLKSNEPQFDRKSFDDLIIRKMFVVPSFEIHGGVKGLFDLGPPACGLKVSVEMNFCD